MISTSIETARIGDKLIVRFVRPDRQNAMSREVINALNGVITSIARQRDVNVVIFTGTGNSFASGADLREIGQLNERSAREFSALGQTLMSNVAALQAETVAAINGYCFGGGLDLALACDRRIASPSATFSHPGVGLGIITGWGGTQRLPRLIGEGRAMEVFLTAKRLSAAEAMQIGLVDQVAGDVVQAALST
jgi:enoyl-CoA hydratase